MKWQIILLLGYTLGAGVIFTLYLLIPLMIMVSLIFPSRWIELLIAIGILMLGEFAVCNVLVRTTLRQKTSMPQGEHQGRIIVLPKENKL